MKKILALTSLIFALSVGATAMAADDTSVTKDPGAVVNYETVKANGYTTVLVHKADDINNIVYVDQADDTFGAALTLMLKADMDDGEYTMKLGGAGKETIASNFTLTTNSGSGSEGSTTDTVVADMDSVATTNNGDGTKNIAFSATVTQDVDAVEFTVTKGEYTATGVLDLKNSLNISGTNADCAILVSNIPDGYNITAKLVKKATSND
jgi:hypothetical protein